MNGFFKAVWYISLNPFVSKLPSGSHKYPSLTSSALMLKLGKLCADAPMRNKRKGYQTTYNWGFVFLAMNSSCWYSLPHWGGKGRGFP
jgi:hypothetical protein